MAKGDRFSHEQTSTIIIMGKDRARETTSIEDAFNGVRKVAPF